MARKTPKSDPEAAQGSGPAAEGTEGGDAYPAVLQRVEFTGETVAFTHYMRKPLPPHRKAGDVFEIEKSLARRLVKYYPDRYRLVRDEKPAPQAAEED